jgi:hypothetical protein
MRKKILLSLFVGLALLFCSSMVKAADTSPYLIGTWEFAVACNAPSGPGSIWYTSVTDFSIVNPTTVALDVYAVFYSNNPVNPAQRLGCFKHTLNPKDEWNLRLSSLPPAQISWLYSLNPCQPGSAPLSESRGTVSFLALPVGATHCVFDQNAVIGGFQQKWMIPSARIFSRSEEDLKGVIINLYTAGALYKVCGSQALSCLPWE